MKKLSSEIKIALLAVLIVFSFFAVHLPFGKVPVPADSLLGLYHPFRDVSFDGYNPGKVPVKNPLITDPVLQTYPWRKLIIKNLKEWTMPLWNPYSFSGQPLLANAQAAPFQITNLLFLIMPFTQAWIIQIISVPVLTALFVFFLARSLNRSLISSSFVALVLPFSGFFIAWLTWGTVITTAMWLPLILLSINKLYRKISPLWILVLILSLSQTLLAGHLQTAIYLLICTVFYSLFQSFSQRNFRLLFLILASLALAFLIAAPQLLPSLEFLRYSARSVDQGYYPGRLDWFIPAKHLIQLIAPDFFGNPTKYNYWGVWNYAEFVSFIGVIPLALAILAAIKKFKEASFFLALAVFSLILAIANPLSKIPYLLNFPVISSMQPSRIIVLLVFSLVILSGYGLDYYLKEKSPRKFLKIILLPFFVLIALALFTLFYQSSFPQVDQLDPAKVALRNLVIPIAISVVIVVLTILKTARLNPKIFLVLIFAITIFDLFRFGYRFIPFVKNSWIFPQTGTIQYLTNQPKPFRIITTDRRIMHPNISSVYDIESIDGYDPLYLKSYAQLISALQANDPRAKLASFNRIVTPQKIDSPLINLLNVQYVLSFDEIKNPNFAKVYQEGTTKVYQNLQVLPRAFFVNEVIKVGTQEEELVKMLDVNFDLSKKATSKEYSFKAQTAPGKVEFIKYEDQFFSLATENSQGAPLVIANVFYPGWKAKLDGQTIAIEEVNYLFQSVLVPAGQHQLEFKFAPDSFYNGLYLSLGGLIVSVFMALSIWRRKSQS